MNIHQALDRLGDVSFALVITLTPSDFSLPSALRLSTHRRPFDLIDLHCSDTLVSSNGCLKTSIQ